MVEWSQICPIVPYTVSSDSHRLTVLSDSRRTFEFYVIKPDVQLYYSLAIYINNRPEPISSETDRSLKNQHEIIHHFNYRYRNISGRIKHSAKIVKTVPQWWY